MERLIKKMECVELCGDVHTSQTQTPIQIRIGNWSNLLVSVSVSAPVCVNAPLRFSVILQILLGLIFLELCHILNLSFQLGILIERSRAPRVDLKTEKSGAGLERLVRLVKNEVEEIKMNNPDKNKSDVEQNEDQVLDSVVDVNKISFMVSALPLEMF